MVDTMDWCKEAADPSHTTCHSDTVASDEYAHGPAGQSALHFHQLQDQTVASSRRRMVSLPPQRSDESAAAVAVLVVLQPKWDVLVERQGNRINWVARAAHTLHPLRWAYRDLTPKNQTRSERLHRVGGCCPPSSCHSTAHVQAYHW